MKVLPYVPRLFLEQGKVHLSISNLSVVKACNPSKLASRKGNISASIVETIFFNENVVHTSVTVDVVVPQNDMCQS